MSLKIDTLMIKAYALLLCLFVSQPAAALKMYFSYGLTEQTEGVRMINIAERAFVSRETIVMQRVALVQPLSSTVSLSLEHSRYFVLNAPSMPAGYSTFLLTVELF